MRCPACEHENPPNGRFCARCGAGLACVECGLPIAPGQRFCTGCGRRMAARGPQTVVRRLDRRMLETAHVRIHYLGGSYAEQRLPAVAARLEATYGALAAALRPEGTAQPLIDVHLVEMLPAPDGDAGSPPPSGYVAEDGHALYEVFRSDAPGVTLERSLAQILLTAAAGGAAARQPAVLEGLLAWLAERESQIVRGRNQAALAELRAQGRLPDAATVLAGPAATDDPTYGAVAGALTGYLIGRFGMPAFLAFARRLAEGGPEEAARTALDVRLDRLDRDWQRSLRSNQGGGIGRFLRGSLPYLRPHTRRVAEILLYIGFAVAFTTLLPLSQKWLIDRALLPGDRGELYRIVGGITALFIVSSVMALREQRLTAYVAESVLRTMRLQIFSRLQRLEPAFFQRMQTGDIMSRMSNDLLSIQFAFTGALAGGLQLVLTLIVSLVTVFWLDWQLGLIAVAGTPLFWVITKLLGPRAAQASYKRQEDLAAASNSLQENLAAQPVVKAFGLEGREIAGYRTRLDALLQSSSRLTFLASLYGLAANSLASGIQLIILGVGGYLIVGGRLSLGDLIAFLSLLATVIGPAQGLSGLMQSLQQATGAMDRIDELLDQQPAITDRAGARALPRLAAAIRLEDVTLSYTGQQANLADLSLTIAAGSKVALVGPSGCGKSTVLNLLMRFYDPDAGRVTFDDVDLRGATLASLRGQIGVVFQDTFLFNTTVRENIRHGRTEATDEEVEAAARAAEIHDLILQMPLGYDTPVGERGSRLSGGQRQRVAIARAVLRNPALLILDEATSALDPRTEAAINRTLDRLAAGRTTIAVTHRLAAVTGMDRIYVLDQGRLREQGTHEELLRQDGLYARLWEEQAGGGLLGGDDPAGRLAAVPLFAGIDPGLLTLLERRMAVERYAAGDAIVGQGEYGERMYIVERGEVEVVAVDAAGTRRLAELGEGDHFGEIALLYDVPRMATVRALGPVQVVSLHRADVQALAAAVPALRDALEASSGARNGAVAVATR